MHFRCEPIKIKLSDRQILFKWNSEAKTRLIRLTHTMALSRFLIYFNFPAHILRAVSSGAYIVVSDVEVVDGAGAGP